MANEFPVLTESELKFEDELVEYLQHIGGSKQWQLLGNNLTPDDLWQNFKDILEQHNHAKLEKQLSELEFSQVKHAVENLRTPYEAGQFIYGFNGKTQIEVDLDDGRHVYLDVFDQDQVGAGDSIYQIAQQVKMPAKMSGKQNRRFDVTLLINGLPMIQIEEKRSDHNVDEALEQMKNYAQEGLYSGIFSTLQLLIAMTQNDVKYMANTTGDKFNKAFAFRWQYEDGKRKGQVVNRWQDFADKVLSIPAAHYMATQYMILDGTKNKQMLKTMRPYQVFATRKVLDQIKQHDFDIQTEENKKLGYVWHTTGSGKTITSFKTAWLANRMPNVDKVVFVVDRIDLINQTLDNYSAYDPDANMNATKAEERGGVVKDTANTGDLRRKLREKKSGIIVTSVQKLNKYINSKNFEDPDQKIVFIVDEAHRTAGKEGINFQALQKAFKKSAWVGYTGTPNFDEAIASTQLLFGDLLDAYTIKNAIADKNVLGFKVDFETTIPAEEFLPAYFQAQYPDADDEKINELVANADPDDIEQFVDSAFYDMNPNHVAAVVDDIYAKWPNRSAQGRYNALLTTRVGGGRASTPMAMMYFNEFLKRNKALRGAGKDAQTLKVAVTFSADSSNGENMIENNQSLDFAMDQYNKEFGTSFDRTTVSEYAENVADRLKDKLGDDEPRLDLVIVVDRLLTGFDAPMLNTLYVDRTLKGANLIQSYSRTNRIQDAQYKPWGHVVNYRWPKKNRKLMDEALNRYSNPDSANFQLEVDLTKSGVLQGSYVEKIGETAELIKEIRDLTDNIRSIPASEKKQDLLLQKFQQFNGKLAQLKQYTISKDLDGNVVEQGYDYENPQQLMDDLGLSQDESIMISATLPNRLKENIVKERNISFDDIDLRLVHIEEVEVNYDYLDELIALLANQVSEDDTEGSQHTLDQINAFADQNMSEQKTFMQKVKAAAMAIFKREFTPAKLPVTTSDAKALVKDASEFSSQQALLAFINKFGLGNYVTGNDLREMFSGHQLGEKDLDKKGERSRILKFGQNDYKEIADEDIRSLSIIQYRKRFDEEINQLADKFVTGEIN
jgi:type I restriction enzyme R subunit